MSDEVELIPDGVTREEIATLFGWPELAGYVAIGLPAEAGQPMLIGTDTSSRGQMIWLIGLVVARLGEMIREDGTDTPIRLLGGEL